MGRYLTPLAVVLVVAAVVFIVTSGESIAVRYLVGLVSLDVAARLVLWERRRQTESARPAAHPAERIPGGRLSVASPSLRPWTSSWFPVCGSAARPGGGSVPGSSGRGTGRTRSRCPAWSPGTPTGPGSPWMTTSRRSSRRSTPWTVPAARSASGGIPAGAGPPPPRWTCGPTGSPWPSTSAGSRSATVAPSPTGTRPRTARARCRTGRSLVPVRELTRIRDVEYVDLPTGHWPQFTRPDDLAGAILASIDGAARRQPPARPVAAGPGRPR